MNLTLQAVLISPHFLFRVEGGRRREAGFEMLDDFALASRLSYFLWASMPDDELFRLAGQNRLHEPDQLKAQALRLLNDPRADALVASFASQWLGLRRLGPTTSSPTLPSSLASTTELRLDLWKETELFVESIVRSNRSIYELLNGRYTFLNERLARHYGIKGISGPEFRRVDFTEERRAGLVTQGSILTLTSHPGTNVAGQTWRMGAHQLAGGRSSRAAAGRASARADAGRQSDHDVAPADGTAPRRPELCFLP